MKVALIPPTDCIEIVERFNTGYHLVLPQMFINDAVYRLFYKDVDGFKILDNGVAEGVSIYHMDLHDVASTLQADEIVVPDVMGDCGETIESARRFEHWARPDQYDYVGVLQGQNMAEVMKCLTFFSNCNWIKNIAVPRILNVLIDKTFRYTFLNALVEHDLNDPERAYGFNSIHCLGYSSWEREVVALETLPNVRGVDTSFPFVMALADRPIRSEYKARAPHYFQAIVDRRSTQWELMNDNVRFFLDWAGCDYKEAPPSEV